MKKDHQSLAPFYQTDKKGP
jgi:hypothetical protein